jgi:hypothetical protein
VIQVNNFYTNKKLWEVTGFLNTLPKNASNYFVLSPCKWWGKTTIPHFAAKNSHGHAKEFPRKLPTIWVRADKKFRRPWSSETVFPLKRAQTTSITANTETHIRICFGEAMWNVLNCYNAMQQQRASTNINGLCLCVICSIWETYANCLCTLFVNTDTRLR